MKCPKYFTLVVHFPSFVDGTASAEEASHDHDESQKHDAAHGRPQDERDAEKRTEMTVYVGAFEITMKC